MGILELEGEGRDRFKCDSWREEGGTQGGTRWEEPEEEENRAGSSDVTA